MDMQTKIAYRLESYLWHEWNVSGLQFEDSDEISMWVRDRETGEEALVTVTRASVPQDFF